MSTTAAHTIYYDQENNCVVMDWDGYATTEQFREGTETMLNILIENKANKVLADTKDMTIIGTEDQKWIETTFLPRAMKYGFKAIAIVKPTSYFNAIAMESISYKVGKDKFMISIFDRIEDAKNWLKTLPF